mmetsp:Transcript_27773/g.70798  ORF Transcript_27773/g.70798 Transcript_27773/m.70798 type:complete len:235 (-) Transcript_27773:25-729(-)
MAPEGSEGHASSSTTPRVLARWPLASAATVVPSAWKGEVPHSVEVDTFAALPRPTSAMYLAEMPDALPTRTTLDAEPCLPSNPPCASASPSAPDELAFSALRRSLFRVTTPLSASVTRSSSVTAMTSRSPFHSAIWVEKGATLTLGRVSGSKVRGALAPASPAAAEVTREGREAVAMPRRGAAAAPGAAIHAAVTGAAIGLALAPATRAMATASRLASWRRMRAEPRRAIDWAM